MEVLAWIVTHRKMLSKAIIGLAVAILLGWGITLHKENKKLSEGLEMAQNNIEAYQGVIYDSQQANNVLKLSVEELSQYNDKLLNDIDSVKDELKIKDSQLKAAATQKQTIYVNDGKGVKGDLVEILKDTVYTDSIKYNPLTTIKYTIGRDTVNIGLDIQNTQYIFFYNTREYKNKKSFIKRLFTFDFKKVTKTRYRIENTNDLINTDDVRVVEFTE